MDDMTKKERIQAALHGEVVDRVPVALWRHWPVDDQYADLLAERAIDYQKRYDWDFIKIPPSSTYCIDDYGAQHEYRSLTSGLWHLGERTHIARVVNHIEDWDNIQPLDITKGTYGRMLQCLKMVVKRRNATVPVIMTVFNPLSMASFLSGEAVFLAHLRQDVTRVNRALSALTKTCSSFVRACMNVGADGIFLSTSAASREVMSAGEYGQFGRPCDLEVLKSASAGWFNILHLHGQFPMFTELSDYPVHAVNWHDRTAGPDLNEASAIFRGALMGGIEQYSCLHLETPDKVEAQVHDAIRQTKAQRLIVTAGCTYPVTVPECNLLSVRHAVETAGTI